MSNYENREYAATFSLHSKRASYLSQDPVAGSSFAIPGEDYEDSPKRAFLGNVDSAKKALRYVLSHPINYVGKIDKAEKHFLKSTKLLEVFYSINLYFIAEQKSSNSCIFLKNPQRVIGNGSIPFA